METMNLFTQTTLPGPAFKNTAPGRRVKAHMSVTTTRPALQAAGCTGFHDALQEQDTEQSIYQASRARSSYGSGRRVVLYSQYAALKIGVRLSTSNIYHGGSAGELAADQLCGTGNAQFRQGLDLWRMELGSDGPSYGRAPIPVITAAAVLVYGLRLRMQDVSWSHVLLTSTSDLIQDLSSHTGSDGLQSCSE
ncbi:hypothetical protein ABZP36_035778 [Zizania latifolia]